MNILKKKNVKNNKRASKKNKYRTTLQKDLKEQLEDENQLLRVENY